MAATSNERPIVIKKKKKRSGGGDGHGGSAWKVAYADFTTAMMAFFMLLWLINMLDEDQKEAIADYFSPTVVSSSESGAGGILGGRTVSSPGDMSSPSSPYSIHEALPGRPEAVEETEILDDGADDVPSEAADPEAVPRDLTDTELADYMAEREQRQFEQAEEALRDAIAGVPELSDLEDNLLIDHTSEGLRIQIVDEDETSMFPSGSAEMFDRTEMLLSLVAQAVDGLPNQISIRGHTDSVPFATDAGYDNWELSADRANASRRALLDADLEADRIANVVGKADTDHLFPDEPDSPRNRRISIMLLRAGEDLMESARATSDIDPDGG